jgi:hypothetical protein
MNNIPESYNPESFIQPDYYPINIIPCPNTPFSLHDNNNYNYELVNSSKDYFKIYKQIMDCYIHEYVNSIYTDSFYNKNQTFYYYLMDKGISTINHIFNMLLIYTKNIDMVEYHCTKVIYYYIEFIGRNSEQDENKIDYNNASIFSYSKTIYNLNKSFRKTKYTVGDEELSKYLYEHEDKESYIFKNVEKMMSLYQIILKLYVDKYNTNNDCVLSNLNRVDKTHLATYISNNIEKYIHNLTLYDDSQLLYIQLLYKKEQVIETVYYYKIMFIIDFINTFNIKGPDSIKYIDNLFAILQHKTPSILNIPELIKKLTSEENKKKIRNETEYKYIEWLLF